MKRKQIFTILVVAGFAVSLTFVASTYGSKQVPVIDKTAQIARGKYMVTIGGCHDCHTPWIIGADGKPGPDMSRALSGHPASFPITRQAKLEGDRWGYAGAATNTAFSGPWGVSFAANLSPDRMTGTGIWTPEIFRNTIRNGRHWGVARPLLPPMPWFNYRHMTDEDLNAVFAYIHTLKPIHNEVPAPLPPAG
jgi:mono/diheme cytochrome c family protein